MKINHKQVETLKSFNGIKLRGNETFDELLEIEKKAKGKFKHAQEIEDMGFFIGLHTRQISSKTAQYIANKFLDIDH